MSYRTLVYEREERVATITLNLAFVETAAREGVGAAVAERDGPFGDYGQAPAGDRPDPDHVIRVGERKGAE